MDKFKEYTHSVWGKSYVWKQPWLELLDNECAKYTINQHNDNLWYAKWWHGIRGYNIGKTKTLEEAKELCVKHLRKMYEGIKAELSLE